MKYKNIEGWFNFETFYKTIITNSKSTAKFVEIGVLCGKSTCYLMEEIQNQNKKIKVIAIDNFSAELRYLNPKLPAPEQLEEVAVANLEEFFNKGLTLITGDSAKTADNYKDEEFDFIFVDGDHSYEQAKLDITAWYPKLKKGGIIAGDDYHPNHIGVIKAVDELFPDKTVENYIWSYKKPKSKK
jgi:predicted O-methyltransferase YrrM